MLDRRSFLRRGVMLGGAATLTTPALSALSRHNAGAATGRPPRRAGLGGGGYGPLVPSKPTAVDTEYAGAMGIDWIALPEGFSYAVIGVAGDTMSDGRSTPTAHDGMAAFAAPGGRVRLVRNHEIRDGDPATPIADVNAYDPLAGAGCTTLQLRFDGGIPVLEQDFVSLNGTAVNCAGGATPWDSWLSSEETTETRGETHGWKFEVPASFDGVVVPVPL